MFFIGMMMGLFVWGFSMNAPESRAVSTPSTPSLKVFSVEKGDMS